MQNQNFQEIHNHIMECTWTKPTAGGICASHEKDVGVTCFNYTGKIEKLFDAHAIAYIFQIIY